MGRGSSGSGGGAGGGGSLGASGGSGVLPQATNFLQPPSTQDVAKGNITPKGGVPFSNFQNMTDDQKADVINDALNTGVPMFLDDSGMQRFAYFTGMTNKPTVVSDSALDNVQGQEIFRTVSNAYNPQTDIGYTASDIAKQISTGDYTMYSDSGGSAHGKAIYFADSVNGSTAYARNNTSLTMRAKITGGNGISESALDRQYQQALSRGDKLAKACSRADRSSAANLYGLAKGYTHKTSGWGYVMVFDRSCLTVSDTYKKSSTISRNGRWK